MATGAEWIADVLQGLFVWAIVALAFWRALQRSLDQATWLNWLGKGAMVGALGCVIGSLAFTGSMVEQYIIVDGADLHAFTSRWFGPYAWSYWARPLSLVVVAVVLYLNRGRRSWWIGWAMAMLVTNPFGLFERLVIVVTSLHRDYVPSDWTRYRIWLDLITPVMLLLSAMLMWRTEHRIAFQRRT